MTKAIEIYSDTPGGSESKIKVWAESCSLSEGTRECLGVEKILGILGLWPPPLQPLLDPAHGGHGGSPVSRPEPSSLLGHETQFSTGPDTRAGSADTWSPPRNTGLTLLIKENYKCCAIIFTTASVCMIFLKAM